MGEFGWAYVSGSQIPDGKEGSLQYKKGNEISGSVELSFDYSTNELNLSGNLNVSGAVNANELNLNVTNKTVTNISMTGSTKFGDTTDDQHKFIGTTILTGAADSALVYRVTSSAWQYLGTGISGEVDHHSEVPEPTESEGYFYLTSSNPMHRGILNYTWDTGNGTSGSIADLAEFVKDVNPTLVVSGTAIFKDPISVQGGLFGASPIDIYAPLVFQRDDLTEATPDDMMRIEQGKFVGNVIITSSNDNHGLWMDGAGYIVMNSNQNLTPDERAPEIVLNNRTGDQGSYPMMSQRVMQAVPVAENPMFLKRRGGGYNLGEIRWGTEFPVLTGSNSSSADQYQRYDYDIVRILAATSPRRNANTVTIQTLDMNIDPTYMDDWANDRDEIYESGSIKPIIHSTSPHYDASNRNDKFSLNNLVTFGGFANPGQENEYGMKRGMHIYGNIYPAGWPKGEDSGFPEDLKGKHCTLGHPVTRWGDMFIHDDRYIKWGTQAFSGSDPGFYKGYYLDNPTTASARNQFNSVILGYNSASAFLEVTGATFYLDDGLNVTGSGYINFGTTKGTSGYGFRDNAGTLEFKNSGGSWTEFGTGTGDSTIGEPEDGVYSDGLFEDLTSSMAVGIPIDRYNEVLKILAPSPAPALSRIDYTNPVGSSAKLSFDASNQITDYANSSTNAGFSAVAEDGLYESATSGNNQRLGIYDGTQDILGVLNFNVVASVTNGQVAYSADSFGNAETGSLKLELNGAVVHTVNLASHGSGNSYLNTTGSGFTSLSVTSSTLDGNGAEWYIFKYRTGQYKIDTLDQRAGWNYARIVHTVGATNYATNYVEWMNDPDGSALALSVTNPRIEEVNLIGSKYVSGVQYNTDLTAKYKVDINNMYRNVYPDGNVITFNRTNADAITAQDLDPIGASEDETKKVQVTASVNNNQNKLLNGTITVSINATHPLKANLSSAGTATLTGMLIDNDTSGPNSNTTETFIDEDFRIKSASYDSQSDLTGSAWNSQTIMTGSNVDGHQDGLLFFNRRLLAPRSHASAVYQLPASGNFSSLANVSAGNPNYYGTTGLRTFFRKIQNTTSDPVYDLKITMEKEIASIRDNIPDNNDIDMYVKIPGKTGWMKSWSNFVFGSVSDGDGALVNGASDNSGIASQAAVTASHCVTFGTASIAAGDYAVVKIAASAGWWGYVKNLQFQLGASDVSAPTESFVLDDIDLDDTNGETAKLSFGASNGVHGYTNVAGGKGSMGAVNSNAVYTDNNDTNRGVFKTIEIMGGTLNEDISESQAGAFLSYSAKSFKNAHTGSLLLIVNDATASTLDLSNLTAHNNLSSNTGFTVSVVDYSTTTDGIPDYTKSYRTGTYSIGAGSQRSGWNYARVLHRIGATDTPTNYVQWVVDTSGAVDNTAVTTPTLSDFGHTDIYYQSGIKYYASNPTASFDFEASNFYSNVYSNESNAISFPTTTNCQVTNIRAVGAGITTFDSAVSQTGMPALNNAADCEVTTIQVTGTLRYDGATPSIFGDLSTFNDYDTAVNATVLHPLKSNRTTSTANKNNLMVYSGSIGSTNLNTEEYFNTETYRIVSGNYANQADITGSSQAWNSQTAMNNGGSHDDGMVTAAGYALSPFKIGVAGNTGHASLQAPAGNPDYSSLTNNTRTFYRYFRNNSGVLQQNGLTISIYGDANLLAKSGPSRTGTLGANKNIFVELKVSNDPAYTGGANLSTGWMDVVKSWDDTEDATVDGAGLAHGSVTQAVTPGSPSTVNLEFQTKGIYNNQYFVVKISAHKDWTGYLSRIRMVY